MCLHRVSIVQSQSVYPMSSLAPDISHPPSDASIAKDASASSQKRRLLLVYVHGFLGSETSFHDFPRHVHDAVRLLVDESHDVYTKVYPRYKTRGDMSIARDNFSQWLSPHEAADLDIILLGHSLGGIVTAEVALLEDESNACKHRILGLINFDVPFLGLHPRVIPTGIGSLFEKKQDENEDSGSGADQIAPPEDDPRFDPSFDNDVHLTQWKGWGGVRHFISKYSNHLSRSIPRYVQSFYDHAGCMHNYPELIKRYKRLARLEDPENREHGSLNRVRFVNYYTASTGTFKKDSKKELEETNSDRIDGDERGERDATEEKDLELKPEDGVLETTKLDSTTGKTESISDSDTAKTQKSESTSNGSKSLRKFCYIPKDDRWTPMCMENMNEVDAHQSMFFPRFSHYEKLVSSTAERIEQWIQDDLTSRFIDKYSEL